MAPKIKILVLPGSVFCIKVLSALEHRNLSYEMVAVHPAKLKKETPPPHLVPVMHYDEQIVPDSKAILKFLDEKHDPERLPLYPAVSKGAADKWSTVEQLEEYAHDQLACLYYYFGGISTFGQNNVSKPLIRSMLPGPVAMILPFLPTLGAKAIAGSMRKRVVATLGEKVVADEAAAKKHLALCLNELEKGFKTPEQKYLFDTDEPTAADFSVFSVLKRFLHPLPDVAEGILGGYPDALKDAGNVPNLERFFEHMNKNFYEGKVDWTTARA